MQVQSFYCASVVECCKTNNEKKNIKLCYIISYTFVYNIYTWNSAHTNHSTINYKIYKLSFVNFMNTRNTLRSYN